MASATVGARRRAPDAPETHSDFQPEIQGLRAIAVLLVVAYHLYPNRLSGGYVGVDVFFVISGYLITSHLSREATRTGHLSLTRFWARRIRRLLPASLLVLAVSAVLTALVVPSTLWEQTVRQIIASTLYVQNWALAGDAVEYSAIGNVPTVVQHYWSLSVEEQFYVIWPILVVGVLLFTRRLQTPIRHRLAALIAIVAIASFIYSVIATRQDAGAAYFITPTRAWEFAAGGLLALLKVRPIGSPAMRAIAGWIGVAAIIWAAFSFDGSTAFPGWIALIPVLGTVAVIGAGGSTSPWTAASWLSRRPATWVGDISYSVYLWHWPLLVALPYATDRDLTTLDKAAIFVVTLAVSWVSTHWIEDPVRRSSFLGAKPWRAFAFGLIGMAVVISGALLLKADLDRQISDSEARTKDALAGVSTTGCLGPPALDPRNACSPVEGDGKLLTSPVAVARQNTTERVFTECQASLDSDGPRTCVLGDETDPVRHVALVGDSHATHWGSAFDAIGKSQHWAVDTYVRSSCPFTTARRTLPKEPPARHQKCEASNAEVMKKLLADDQIDTVFVSAYSSAYGWTSQDGSPLANPARDGFREAWAKLVDSGKKVVVLRDVPKVKDNKNSPACLEENADDRMACATRRSESLLPDVEAEAAKGQPGVSLIDLTDRICDDETCYAVVGDVIVYRDYSHLTSEYSTMLAPYILRAFEDTKK